MTSEPPTTEPPLNNTSASDQNQSMENILKANLSNSTPPLLQAQKTIQEEEKDFKKRSDTLGSYSKMKTIEGIEEEIEECFYGKTFLSKEGEITARPLLTKNIICLYFSAYWCPPCRTFTPFLTEFYKEILKKNNDFEIIFVSRDKDQDQFDLYYSQMPWLAIPYNDPRIKIFQKHFTIKRIPSLIVLGRNGEKICYDGRSEVVLYDFEAYERWKNVELAVVKEEEEEEEED